MGEVEKAFREGFRMGEDMCEEGHDEDSACAKYLAALSQPRPSQEGEAVRKAFIAGAQFGSTEAFCPEHSCGPAEREIAEAADAYALAALHPSQAPTAQAPAQDGREIWMLETRGILDPRYWASSRQEAEEYLEANPPKERPRLVRLVEAQPHPTAEPPTTEVRRDLETVRAALKKGYARSIKSENQAYADAFCAMDRLQALQGSGEQDKGEG